jgi:hypothetical protein
LFFILNGCSTLSGVPKSPLEFSNPWFESNDSENIINNYSKKFAEKAGEIGDESNGIIDENKRNNLISMALTIMDYRYA